MSASSLWVTWGIITQLRARFGAEMRWIRERSTRSTGPNFSKSTLRPREQVEARHAGHRRRHRAPATTPAGRRRGALAVGEALDVVPGDASLAAAAGHRAQVDAQLTGQPSR